MAIKFKYDLINQSSGQSYIKLRFDYKGKRFVYGTEQKIYPELWDKNILRPTIDKELIKKFIEIDPEIKTKIENTSQRLDNIESLIKKFFSHKELGNEKIDFDELKNFLKDRFNFEKTTKVKKVIKEISPYSDIPFITEVIDQFIKEIKSGKKTIIEKNKSRKYDKMTIKAYVNFLNFFIEFQEYTNKKYTLLDIDPKFEQKLHNYFDFLEYEPSSKGNKVKALKSIVNDFIDNNYLRISDNEEIGTYEGITTKQLERVRFVTSKLKKPTGTTTKVVLTEKEINTLFEIDLSQHQTLQKTKDIFLIGCYTGLRHSDYNTIQKENIKGDWLEIIIRKGKTGKRVKIPIRPELNSLFEKYDFKLPTMSSQKIGLYIKEVCKIAGIDEQIEVIKNAGGIETRTWTPKYELISSHTARRSGLTLMNEKGISKSDLLLISGHSTEKQLNTYIFIDPKEWENRIITSDFVKPTHLKVV